MYRCQVCKDVSKPGQKQLKHVIRREVPAGMTLQPVRGYFGGWEKKYFPTPKRTDIAQEIPVCKPCCFFLEAGMSLKALLKQGGRPIQTIMEVDNEELTGSREF